MLNPPHPRDDDDLDGRLCPSAKVPDGDDEPGGLGESVPWRNFALDGFRIILGRRGRRSVAERILNLVDRPQHTS